MEAVIFAGPTLHGDPILGARDFRFLPPAASGDLYLAARLRPPAIGLVDGSFEAGPAIWHKEILWALSQGIRVYGAASMGALRAAEMYPFGMVGVGAIYEQFRRGVLEDDDEVAVLHMPEELAYRPLTEAMVDIRATLGVALAERRVSVRTADALLRIAKTAFFKERTWNEILARATKEKLPRSQLAALTRWIPKNHVEQKRFDALAMLGRMRRASRQRTSRFHPRFAFEHTQYWQSLLDRYRAR